MQRISLTYRGALRRAMNCEHGGENIFFGSGLKKTYIDFLAETYRKLKAKMIACCFPDNHYHLVVEKGRSRLSELFKGDLNEEIKYRAR